MMAAMPIIGFVMTSFHGYPTFFFAREFGPFWEPSNTGTIAWGLFHKYLLPLHPLSRLGRTHFGRAEAPLSGQAVTGVSPRCGVTQRLRPARYSVASVELCRKRQRGSILNFCHGDVRM